MALSSSAIASYFCFTVISASVHLLPNSLAISLSVQSYNFSTFIITEPEKCKPKMNTLHGINEWNVVK